MNKWITVSLVVLVLAGAYLFLPNGLYINQNITVKVNTNSAYRCLSKQNKWDRWWPGNKVETDLKHDFTFGQYSYHLQQSFFRSFVIQVNGKDSGINSTLSLIPLGEDYTIFEWKAAVTGSSFQKIRTYLRAKSIQNDFKKILDSLQHFYENEENIYGFKMQRTKVKDTFLLTTRFTTSSYPTIDEIYRFIGLLKEYATLRSATVTNYPMLHVLQKDSGYFENMVAIPISKEIEGNDKIAFKRMFPGNILEGEVKGGAATAQEAMVQLDNYVADHQMESPAIPFMLLVTDRSKEKDTSKWITRVYYPVY